jgi:hypothetical protein
VFVPEVVLSLSCFSKFLNFLYTSFFGCKNFRNITRHAIGEKETPRPSGLGVGLKSPKALP